MAAVVLVAMTALYLNTCPRKAAREALTVPVATCAIVVSSKCTMSSARMTVAVAFHAASADRTTRVANAPSEADEPNTAATDTAPEGTDGHDAWHSDAARASSRSTAAVVVGAISE